jgi:hypothetical protein
MRQPFMAHRNKDAMENRIMEATERVVNPNSPMAFSTIECLKKSGRPASLIREILGIL